MPPAQDPSWSGSFSGQIEHRLFSHITMNWRGRPLTSHEVIVASIAATTTRTGLTVHAELDSGAYPTGVEVSDAQIAALAMNRHRFHGDWNYTLAPHRVAAAASPVLARVGRDVADHAPNRALLSDPELTGMSREQLDAIATTLAEPQAAQREHHRQARRGAPRRRAAGAGRAIKLNDADRILATVLYLRRLRTQAVLGKLFNVDRKTITTAVQETRPLLDQHGYTVTPSTARLPMPADLIAFLADSDTARLPKIKPAS
jgi:hypothetical protein